MTASSPERTFTGSIHEPSGATAIIHTEAVTPDRLSEALAADRTLRGFKSFSGFGTEPDDEVGRR